MNDFAVHMNRFIHSFEMIVKFSNSISKDLFPISRMISSLKQ